MGNAAVVLGALAELLSRQLAPVRRVLGRVVPGRRVPEQLAPGRRVQWRRPQRR